MPKIENIYKINGEITTVITSSGNFIIDTEDVEKIKKYHWHISSKGYPHG